jgi:RNA polymerase sigma factor (sigma-70 family)
LRITENEILVCLQTGKNEKVLEYLYDSIFPKIRKYICSNSGSAEDAIDIFQDAVVILCKHVRTGRYDNRQDLSGFLFTVSKNLWINKVKQSSRMVRLEKHNEATHMYDFTADIITHEKAQTLKQMIRQLGEKCFELLQLAVYQQLDYQEICVRMGFATVNAVKTQKYKCKQKLMELIKSNPSYQEVIE